ncbi:MAG: Gfo/Idh/MocA family oxidoreductase [Fimbriimonadaceae bacterium]|nr:Gfo/Idh/MocA family oxidoreductase [Fimbriimonadaceae bacterium]
MKLVQIGCGPQARGAHGPAQAKAARCWRDLELAACCDLRLEAAERYAAAFGFERVYTDLDALLDRERPDAAVLVVAVEATAALAARVLARGIPLLLEKPPGLTLAECDALIAAAGPTPHQVAFNRRHAPLVRELHRLLPQPLRHLRYDLIRCGRRDPDFSTTAIHGLDTVRHLAGDFAVARLHYQELPHEGPQVANVWIDAEMTSGATAHLAFCPTAGVLVERATAHGDGVTLFADLPLWASHDGVGRLQRIEAGRVTLDLPGDRCRDGQERFEEAGFGAQTRSFLEALRGGRPPTPSLAESRQSVALMQALRERVEVFRG